MSTVQASGAQAATLDTEHSLTTIQVAGTYVLTVDVADLANDETLILRIKRETRDGDTKRQIDELVVKHAQGNPIVHTLPYETPVDCSLEFTLEQTGGTGRTFEWTVDKL